MEAGKTDYDYTTILADKTDYDPHAFIIEPVINIQKEKTDATKWWKEFQTTSYYLDFQLQTKIIISAIKRHPEIKSVFEFGCHSGRNLYFIKRELLDIQEVYGIDINAAAIKIGKEKFHIPLKVGNEMSLSSIPDGKYDAVFTVSVINHIVEPETVCKELARIAKRYIILLEPFLEREGKITKMKKANLTENFFPFCYSWDYKRLFSGLDVKMIRDKYAPLEGGFASPYYRLYVFERCLQRKLIISNNMSLDCYYYYYV